MNLHEMENILVPCNPVEFRGFEGEGYYVDNVSLENIHIKQPIVEDLNFAKSWYDDGSTDGFGGIILKRCKNINAFKYLRDQQHLSFHKNEELIL